MLSRPRKLAAGQPSQTQRKFRKELNYGYTILVYTTFEEPISGSHTNHRSFNLNHCVIGSYEKQLIWILVKVWSIHLVFWLFSQQIQGRISIKPYEIQMWFSTKTFEHIILNKNDSNHLRGPQNGSHTRYTFGVHHTKWCTHSFFFISQLLLKALPDLTHTDNPPTNAQISNTSFTIHHNYKLIIIGLMIKP